MSPEKGPFHFLKKFRSKEPEDGPPQKKKGGNLQYFIIILLFGVSFMLVSDLWSSKQNNTATPVAKQNQSEKEENVPTFGSSKTEKNQTMRDYENYYENQLKEALDEIAGVNDVSIVVNVESTARKIYEKNEVNKTQITSETDQEGGKRKIENQTSEEQLVIIQNGEKETPLILETRKPEIRGVLVVAKGADNIQVKKWIIESVTRTLDVPSHRVAVMPKK